jgi:hypothetical protein
MIKTRNSLIAAGVVAFNARHWDDAFMQFQTHWLADRSDESKALAQYANALNQLTLGLTTAPRTMLNRSLELTADARNLTGVDIHQMRVDVRLILGLVPPDDVPNPGIVIPSVTLEWIA